jgi:arsenite methyltransferase
VLSIPKIIWYEATSAEHPRRQPEPRGTMDDQAQVESYVKAYEWGGPTSALQLHHIRELSCLIRAGDTILDLACGPGPLLLELAALFKESTFIGADLSAAMLEHLRRQATAMGLHNVVALQEDVRSLPSIEAGTIDLAISTSALHHLQDENDLRTVFRRINSVLKPGGGFYLFDFGLLKSRKARQLFVAEVAKLAPPITARDYDLSLQAAFPLDVVFEIARDELPKPFTFAASAFVDFFFLVQTPYRATRPRGAQRYIEHIWRRLSNPMKLEHLMLRRVQRSREMK